MDTIRYYNKVNSTNTLCKQPHTGHAARWQRPCACKSFQRIHQFAFYFKSAGVAGWLEGQTRDDGRTRRSLKNEVLAVFFS